MIDLNTFKKNKRKKHSNSKNVLKKTISSQKMKLYFSLIRNLNKAKSLENKNKEQNIKLKKVIAYVLLYFLIFEIIMLFIFAILQGFKLQGFYLDKWAFRLIIFGTISQINTTFKFVVKNLFTASIDTDNVKKYV